jgi:hypothetical protein
MNPGRDGFARTGFHPSSCCLHTCLSGDDARYFQISVPVQPGNSGLRRAGVVSQSNASQGIHARLITREQQRLRPRRPGGALVDERGNVVGVVSAKLSARAALASSGALPENVNYAVKSSYLLSFLESVPDVAAKLKEANTKDTKFEDVVKSAEQAAVLVLVY